jgi:ribokinase
METDRTTAEPQLVGIGCAALDHLVIVRDMPRFDAAESARAQDWLIAGGGPVSTALAAASRLGVPAAYVGVMGDDTVGQEIRREFLQAGVDVRALRHRSGVRSMRCLVLVEAGTGRRAFISFGDWSAAFELTAEDEQLVRQTRFLHLDGWYPEAALAAASLARASGVRVCLDAYSIGPRTADFVAAADVVIATESFPSRFTGEHDLDAASRQMLGYGPQVVVTTLSDRGCFVAAAGERHMIPGFSVEVVDTTGAGDAFHGAFLYGMLKEWDLVRTARFSNAVGALTCRKLGGRASLPTLAEVESLLTAHAAGSSHSQVVHEPTTRRDECKR